MKDSKLKRLLLSYWDVLSPAIRAHKIRRKYSLPIMTSEQTVAHIQKYNCSIARYGDGDFGLMLKTAEEGYQNFSNELSEALQKVFMNNSKDLLICIPYPMVSTKEFLPHGKAFWRNWSIGCQEKVVTTIRNLAEKDYVFGDSFVSRPYTGYKSKKKAGKRFSLLKELWDDRDILFVEGAQTRLGVGNDLFSNARSVKRILCPAENAFDVYDQILETTVSCWRGELVILALGPTATVLASDLSKRGIQALDLGHIDIQYEWFLADCKDFTPVPGKYTNDAVGGRTADACEDPEYLAQIIAEVK